MLRINRKSALGGLLIGSALLLGGCYNDGYGYSSVSVGVGNGGYYDPYGGYGYGTGYGWNDGFYYPGSGYWLYDRGGNRHRWNDSQRRYWEARRERHRDRDHAGRPDRPDRPGNWQGRADRPHDEQARPDRPNRLDRPDRNAWRERREALRDAGVPAATIRAARPDRPQRAERPNRVERPAAVNRQPAVVRAERMERRAMQPRMNNRARGNPQN